MQDVCSSPEHLEDIVHLDQPTTTGRYSQVVQSWYAGVFSFVVGDFGEDTARRPGPGEPAYWSGRTAAVGPLAAYRELYYAPEVVAHRVTDHHQDLLGRDPRPDETRCWSPKEVESDINVQVLLVSTPEHRSYLDVR